MLDGWRLTGLERQPPALTVWVYRVLASVLRPRAHSVEVPVVLVSIERRPFGQKFYPRGRRPRARPQLG